VKTYKELGVWRKAVDLTTEVFRITRHFPDDENFGLTSQIRRAAVSIPANIAEGWGRGTTREYLKFLLISRGSLMELETHDIISARLGYLSKEETAGLNARVDEIGRMLNGLIQKLRNRDVASRSPVTNP
jgi:four helix bundle protein